MLLLVVTLFGCKHAFNERDLVGQWTGALSVSPQERIFIRGPRIEEYGKLTQVVRASLILGENNTYTLDLLYSSSTFQGYWTLEEGRVVLNQTWSSASTPDRGQVMVPDAPAGGAATYELSPDGKSMEHEIQVFPSESGKVKMTFTRI